MNRVFQSSHNPDVLSTFSNLSNDEVFTPPKIVNEMLDLLPQTVFKDKNAKFLDPATKSGVFLREIAKRLLEGLKEEIPILQERIDHIFHNQLFGIAITELTSLLARRTLYCSKYPNSVYSISIFDNVKGNVLFNRVDHEWRNNSCIKCGANKIIMNRESSLENHAYEFIHTNNLKELSEVKFDVIIGNPPYQMKTGGAQAQATPLYNKFIEQAIKLNPRYLSMIIPSRWFTGGFGLDNFRKNMLNDQRIRIIHDYLNARDCFPNVDIKGGVNYFLWDRDNIGDCEISTFQNNEIISKMIRPLKENDYDFLIRYNDAIPILRKIQKLNEETLSESVSSQRPFGLATNFKDIKDTSKDGFIKIYAYKKIGYVSLNYVTKNEHMIDKWKVLVPKAVGSGESDKDIFKPILAEPNSVCTETYIVIGSFDSKIEANNLISYINTNFFHFLVTLVKNTQDALKKVYQLVPVQNFEEIWSDKKLEEKYGLIEKEKNFIKSLLNRD